MSCQDKTESAHNTQIKCLANPTDSTRFLCCSDILSCVVHTHNCPNTVGITEESSRASHGQDTLQHEKPWKSPDLHFVQTSDVLQSVCSHVYPQPFIISRRRQHFAGLSCSGSTMARPSTKPADSQAASCCGGETNQSVTGGCTVELQSKSASWRRRSSTKTSFGSTSVADPSAEGS